MDVHVPVEIILDDGHGDVRLSEAEAGVLLIVVSLSMLWVMWGHRVIPMIRRKR